VVLAEDKENEIKYTMKIIEKIKIKEFNLLQCQVIKEISQNDLFVKIRETFQNEKKIYIVMEFLPRGDIYYYLKQKSIVFREEIIKMIVSEIICGI
jgi:serine/threonine protein kinase